MKKIFAMLLAAIQIVILSSAVYASDTFEDYTSQHPMYNIKIDGFGDNNVVETMTRAGIIKGVEENGHKYLKPDTYISRAEFLVLVMRSRFGERFVNTEISKLTAKDENFADAAGHWAEGYMNVAKKYEIANAVSSNCFMPDAPISRGDMILFLMTGQDIVPSDIRRGSSVRFSDVDSYCEYYSYVNTASQTGLITGSADGLFRPYAYATRIETIIVLARYLGIMESLEGEEALAQISLIANKTHMKQSDAVMLEIATYFPRYEFFNVDWSSSDGKLYPLDRQGTPCATWVAENVAADRTYNVTFECDYLWKSRLGEYVTQGSSVVPKSRQRHITKTIEIAVAEKPAAYVKKIGAQNNKMNISAEIDNETLVLSWNDTNAKSYTVKKGTRLGTYNDCKTVTSNSCRINIAGEKESCYFVVVSSDGDTSSPVVLSTYMKTPVVSMVNSGAKYILTWNRICAAEYYVVERKLKQDNDFYSISEKLTENYFIDNQDIDYSLYDYRVVCYNYATVEGQKSEAASVQYTDASYLPPSGDNDGDTLTNEQELALGTSPFVADSDLDGLDDGEEVALGTNPRISDSDGDKMSDGAEILAGLNPLAADAQERTTVEVSDRESGVTASCEGSVNILNDNISIKESPNYVLRGVKGLACKPIEIKNADKADSVTVTFPVPDRDLNGDSVSASSLSTYGVNKETKQISELTDKKVTNTEISVNTQGNDVVLLARKNDSITESDFNDIDVVFCVDQSGSMDSSDPQFYRIDTARNFIGRFDFSKFRAGITEFETTARAKHNLDTNIYALNETLEGMKKTYGSTSISGGIDESSYLFGNDARKHMIVLLSDGQHNSGYSPKTAAENAYRNNAVVINTIGLGSGVNKAQLEEISDVTGGKNYYIIDNTEYNQIYVQMTRIYNEIFGDLNFSDQNAGTLEQLSGFLDIDTGEETININVNSTNVFSDTPPVIVDGRTLIPVRAVLEKMGAWLKWDDATKTVIINTPLYEIKLQIGSKTAYVNGKEVPLDVPASVVDGRTVIPVRFVAENMGASVKWDADTRTVYINTDNYGTSTLLSEIKKVFSLTKLNTYTLDNRKYDCYIMSDSVIIKDYNNCLFFINNELVTDRALIEKLSTISFVADLKNLTAVDKEIVDTVVDVRNSTNLNIAASKIGNMASVSLGAITSTILTGGGNVAASVVATNVGKATVEELVDSVTDIENLFSAAQYSIWIANINVMRTQYQQMMTLCDGRVTTYEQAKKIEDCYLSFKRSLNGAVAIMEAAVEGVSTGVGEYLTDDVLGGFMDGFTCGATEMLKTADNIREMMMESDDFYNLVCFAVDISEAADELDKLDNITPFNITWIYKIKKMGNLLSDTKFAEYADSIERADKINSLELAKAINRAAAVTASSAANK